jgi:3-oxoacyl-[acyl-carrier protein] reductase
VAHKEETEIQKYSCGGTPNHHAKHHPLLGRRGMAQEVAGSAAWLAGASARFITGQVVHLNGGTCLGAGWMPVD